MKKLFALILALALVFSLSACGSKAPNEGGTADNDKVYTVSLQFTYPESSAAPVEAVLAEIEEASNGRLKFEVYYSFSMVGNTDVVDALQSGTLDIAGLMPNEFSFFNLNGRLCGMPLLNFADDEAATKIYLSMLYNNEDMMAEFTDNDLILWGGSMCPGYQMFFAQDVTGTDPSLFTGLTIMADNPEMQSFISNSGGAVAAAIPPDYYSNLSNGVAEGLIQHLNCVNAFGCLELTKTMIKFGEGGFYNLPLVFCISEKFWDELPEDLQNLMGEYADDICRAGFESDMAQLESNQGKLENINVVDLNEKEKSAWIDAFQPILDSALDTIAADNAAAPEVYEQLTGMIEGYDAASFEIGTNNFGHAVEW